MQVTYTPDKPRLFWLREKPEDPQFDPHAGIKMAQVLGSPLYIYGPNWKWEMSNYSKKKKKKKTH